MWVISNPFKFREPVKKRGGGGTRILVKYLKLKGHVKLFSVTVNLTKETEN